MADGSCSGERGDDANGKSGCKMQDLVQVRGVFECQDYCEEDDCRKKRYDRYDSSESSDSGVAVLSCTDCSGSSTASSDITDPGSPFSTASTHSEDSAPQPSKMPPTHHPPWPWTTETVESAATATTPINKRSIHEKTAFPKRLKAGEDTTTASAKGPLEGKKTKVIQHQQQQQQAKQGKITEYFKSQVKLHSITQTKKDTKVDQQTQFNGIRTVAARPSKKPADKPRKHHVTVPRKILPAPSKLPDAMLAVPAAVTYVGFPPALTYLKAAKPPDAAVFVPQFRTLNVIQPVQKIAVNCVKVVPIVKLNTMAARLGVETAVPTVLQAKPKTETVESAKCRIGMEDKRLVEEKTPSPTDSDSGVSTKDSLEVAVDVVVTTPPQKSPILSQPKTIRFPPAKDETKDAKATHTQESGLCRWTDCSAQFDTSGALLEHLQIKHVISQATQEQYVCLWLGCKVHGRTSCSRSWLERHVLAHAGTKPFRCIVDGCGQRFNSQLTLERHVNNHFTSDGSQATSAKKSTDSSSAKLFKRNGKRIRFRRQPWSARMFDFMDSGIMEGLQHKLLTMTQSRASGQIHNAGNTMNMLSQVLARRVEPDGRVQVLVKWHPVDIIPDEWVPEKEFVATKAVEIPSLDPSAKDALCSRLFPPPAEPRKQQERRRKPVSKQHT